MLEHLMSMSRKKGHFLISIASVEGQRIAHFRGRRLLGSAVPLPAGYTGVVMTRPETSSTKETVDSSVFSAAEPAEETAEDTLLDLPQESELVVAAEFDELVVWAHDSRPDGSVDPYIRSAVEWVQLAEKVYFEVNSQGVCSG